MEVRDEIRRRDWMMYSRTSGKIFGIYYIFGDKENSFCKRFKDWKHGRENCSTQDIFLLSKIGWIVLDDLELKDI